MTLADGMKLFREITQTKGLDLMATLKAISEGCFHILNLTDAGWENRWFFRHNRDKNELERRCLITEKKLQTGNLRKKKRWGHNNAGCAEYRQYGYGERKGDGDNWNAKGEGQLGAKGRWS